MACGLIWCYLTVHRGYNQVLLVKVVQWCAVIIFY